MTASATERQAARDYLLNNADPDTQDLLDAIRAVYGDGVVTGAGTAAEATSTPVAASLTTLLPDSTQGDIDWGKFWDSWQPGDAKAAALLKDGGFSRLLDQAQVTVKGITGTLLDRMGTVLADGVKAGDSTATIAKALSSIVTDPDRAQVIAHTELARATTVSSLQTYAEAGVQWELLTSPDACDECVDIADAGPYDAGDGDDAPPIHPSCECSVSPVVPA